MNRIKQIYDKYKAYFTPKVITAIVLSLAVIILFTVGVITSKKSVFMPLGFGLAVVTSGSMEPELSVNEVVFVVKSNTYSQNDIVVYEKDGYAVVHRIVSVSEDQKTVITRGDANNIEDAPIEYSSIKGKVAFSIPIIGGLVRFLKSGVGAILLLIIAFVAIETIFYINKRKNDQKAEQIKKKIEELK